MPSFTASAGCRRPAPPALHPQIHFSWRLCARAVGNFCRHRAQRPVVQRYGSAAATLLLHVKHWRERFANNRAQAPVICDERFCRMWGILSRRCRARIPSRLAHGVSIAPFDQARRGADHARFHDRRRANRVCEGDAKRTSLASILCAELSAMTLRGFNPCTKRREVLGSIRTASTVHWLSPSS